MHVIAVGHARMVTMFRHQSLDFLRLCCEEKAGDGKQLFTVDRRILSFRAF